jgi:hypothetical protein
LLRGRFFSALKKKLILIAPNSLFALFLSPTNISGLAHHMEQQIKFLKNETREELERRKDEWSLKDDDIQHAIEMSELDNIQVYDHTDFDLLLFLYAKKIFDKMTSRARKLEFADILEPHKVESRVMQYYQHAKERLERIVRKEEQGSDFTSESETLFDSFVKLHPEWEIGKSFVVFRDHPALKSKPHAYVERFQKSGLCYMHAPVILQHYLVAMNSESQVPMLDMSAYMRHHMHAEALERYIRYGSGGDSQVFMEKFLESGPNTEYITCCANESMVNLLEEYGPALIHRFQVESEFYNTDTWQHSGRKTHSASEGLHAMVLIGYRKEKGQIRFLMQNWWKKKQFVDVDIEYLDSCTNSILFVKTKQTGIGKFKTDMHQHVESEKIDSPENFDDQL